MRYLIIAVLSAASLAMSGGIVHAKPDLPQVNPAPGVGLEKGTGLCGAGKNQGAVVVIVLRKNGSIGQYICDPAKEEPIPSGHKLEAYSSIVIGRWGWINNSIID